MTIRSLGLTLLLLLGLSAPAAAQEGCYYVVVFGSQPPGLKIVSRRCHSFATFIHVAPDGCVSAFTISWLPLDASPRPLWPHPEVGRNFTLEETLQLCQAKKLEVGAWGPYQITPELWERAVHQKQRLDSGQVFYKAVDNGSPGGRISNCLHAISFIVQPPGERLPEVIVAPANWGESGSYWITLTLRPWFVDPCRPHPELLQRLGVNTDSILFYDLSRNPTRDPVIRTTQAVLQFYLLPNRVRCDR